MKFSQESNVTVVITSCGRFDLLKRTLESFDRYNTCAINKVIITEDSGNDKITAQLPEHWIQHTEIIVNRPKLGQIRSIDLAYSHVETEYIFHCEDDWLFSRSRFIEDSLEILEGNKNILQVWLRDYDSDVGIHYPFHYLGEKGQINQIIFYKLGSHDSTWKGFSFNPGLRRKIDYLKLAPFYNEESSEIREGEISRKYHSMGFFLLF